MPRTRCARIGLFRREPAAAHAAALAGARPVDAPPLDPARLAPALARLAAIAPPPEPPPEVVARDRSRSPSGPRSSARPCATRRRVVLQDLLTGVRDRVVIAVTFLAMLELMKRREIVVEQAEPWGPIVARATTAEERAAAGIDAATRTTTARRDAGVVRVTDALDPVDARRATGADAATRAPDAAEPTTSPDDAERPRPSS